MRKLVNKLLRRAEVNEARKELEEAEEETKEIEEVYRKLNMEISKNMLAPRFVKAFRGEK